MRLLEETEPNLREKREKMYAVAAIKCNSVIVSLRNAMNFKTVCDTRRERC